MNITTQPIINDVPLFGKTRAWVVLNAIYQYALQSNDWFDALDMAVHLAQEEMENLTDDSNEDDQDYAHGLADGVEQLRRIASERAAKVLTAEQAAEILYPRRERA